jgi:hypothetical protein
LHQLQFWYQHSLLRIHSRRSNFYIDTVSIRLTGTL